VLAALAGICLLWWLARTDDDPVGEMVTDMDAIDSEDDPGYDVDET
jgi:hypothetical protein